MPHGTTVYFKHADTGSWRTQLSKFEELLADFGAIQRILELGRSPRKFWATITKGPEASSDGVTVFSTHERTSTITCDSIDSLVDGSIQQVELNWLRPLLYPAAPRGDIESSRTPDSRPLSITLSHRPEFYSDEFFRNQLSRGVWKLDVEIALDPQLAPMEVESLRYAYEEVWDYYELMKRIHHEMGFDLTAGSFVENYYEFGETEGHYPGFDSLFRFDRNGPSRLILPYEERRPFRTECDEDGNHEVSLDLNTGLLRCVVPTGAVG